MSDIIKGTVFANGQSVDATALNNLVDLAVVQPDLIDSRAAEVSPSTADTILVYQAGPPAVLKKVALNNLPGLTSTQTADNTGMGQGAFGALTTGTGNAAFGKNALTLLTEGSNSTAIGHEAGYASQGALGAAAEDNTNVGYRAGYGNIDGEENVFVGKSAGYAPSGVERCVGVGAGAMEDASGALLADNTAVGNNALKNAIRTAGTEGSNNTAIGSQALKENTTAEYNTAVGVSALTANTTGAGNTGLGHNALSQNVDGTNNTAVGFQAGVGQIAAANSNTCVGSNSGALNVSGDESTMIGAGAGENCIHHTRTTAVGFDAMKDTGTLMVDNTAVGYNALKNATYTAGQEGSENTAIGSAALQTNTSGRANTAVGYGALFAQTAVGGHPIGNTAVGWNASSGVLTAAGITTLGYASAVVNTTADNGTNIGRFAGYYKTAENCTALGSSADMSAAVATLDHTTALGYAATPFYANETVFAPSDTVLRPGSDGLCDLGRSNYQWKDTYLVNAPTVSSDASTKKNIKDTDLGLDFINKLKPRKYQLRDQKAVKNMLELPEGAGKVDIGQPARKFKRTHYGLIAQEVKEVLGETDFGGYVDKAIKGDEGDGLALRYEEFISPLIAAVKELSAKVAVLESNG